MWLPKSMENNRLNGTSDSLWITFVLGRCRIRDAFDRAELLGNLSNYLKLYSHGVNDLFSFHVYITQFINFIAEFFMNTSLCC